VVLDTWHFAPDRTWHFVAIFATFRLPVVSAAGERLRQKRLTDAIVLRRGGFSKSTFSFLSLFIASPSASRVLARRRPT
jgi:hypothetical protein